MRVAMSSVGACVLVGAIAGVALDENPFLLAVEAVSICGDVAVVAASNAAGENHFEDHLTPAFHCYIQREFAEIVRTRSPSQVEHDLRLKVNNISDEHERQFERALIPAIKKVTELPEPVRIAATELIPRQARELRFDTFRLVLGELKEQGFLKAQMADSLINTIPLGEHGSFNATQEQQPSIQSTSPGVDGPRVFQVTSRTGTGILLKQGDRVTISAIGQIRLGAFAGATGPDGIPGFQNYSHVLEAPHGALLARVRNSGSERWALIGSNRSFVASNSGILEFLVNDADPGNNQGQFVVTIKVATKH